jgi:hypothetical protein
MSGPNSWVHWPVVIMNHNDCAAAAADGDDDEFHGMRMMLQQ